MTQLSTSSSDGRRRLTATASGGLAVQIFAAAASLGAAMVLARFMAPSEYGVYALAWAVTGILAVPASLGLPTAAVRFAAAYVAKREWELLVGLGRWAIQATVVASATLIVVSLLAVSVAYTSGLVGRGFARALGLSLFLIPGLTLTAVNGGLLRGLGRVVAGLASEQLIRPTVLLASLALVALLFNVREMSAVGAILLLGVGTVAALIVSAWLFRTTIMVVPKSGAARTARLWLRSGVPLIALGGLEVLNDRIDLLMVGSLLGVAESGVYYAASRSAGLVYLIVVAVTIAVAPSLARAHARQEHAQLQLLVTHAARLVLLLATPVTLLLVLGGRYFLALTFGPDYDSGAEPLAILALGQFVAASLAVSSQLLLMTGLERVAAGCVAVGAMSNIALNILLVPVWGVTGAAMATSLSLVVVRVLLATQSYRLLGVVSAPVGMGMPK